MSPECERESNNNKKLILKCYKDYRSGVKLSTTTTTAMSSTSLDSAPSESSTQLPGLSTTSNNQSDSITPDATLKQTDIPPQPQSSINNESLDNNNNNNNNQSQQDKKQTVFEIAQNIEENLNKLLKQLDNTDNEINTKIDLALKNINSLYDKTTTATATNAS